MEGWKLFGNAVDQTIGLALLRVGVKKVTQM